jgi:hypothetical protein
MGTRRRELAIRGQIGDGFGENGVGARFHAGHRAGDGRVDPLRGERVGAGHDDEVSVGPRVDRGLDAVDHLFLGDDLFARAMTAALGAYLILDVHARRAELDQ